MQKIKDFYEDHKKAILIGAAVIAVFFFLKRRQ